MNQTHIDTMGLTYEKVVGIQESLKAGGIGSHISANSLCIHTTPEIFRETRPDLVARILRKGEAPFAQEYSAAVKSETTLDGGTQIIQPT